MVRVSFDTVTCELLHLPSQEKSAYPHLACILVNTFKVKLCLQQHNHLILVCLQHHKHLILVWTISNLVPNVHSGQD